MKAFVVRHDRPVFSAQKCSDSAEAEAQLAHYEEASAKVDEDIHAMMKKASNSDEVTILEAQSFMLKDPDFTSRIRHLILDDYYNAPMAVETAAGQIIDQLSKLGSQMFRENIYDVQDIASRLISTLTKEKFTNIKELEEKVIVVADTILPSELLAMDVSMIGAICLDGGGSTSHVAILARSMNIPAVFALKDASSRIESGGLAAVDGLSGILYIDPDEKTVRRIKREKRQLEEEERLLKEDAVLPAITKDGVRIRLECNIDGIDHVESSLKNGAEGAGLLRTEFLLMTEGKTYSEDEQAEIYAQLASAFFRRGPVTIRTYDVGGDKVVSDLHVDEDNPVLGWRAVRFCMSRRDIFRTQLRAVLRASGSCPGRIRLMFPMISGPDELDDVLSFFESVKAECRSEGIAFDEDMKTGTMIEVPSAAITSDILASKVDFFSVGTNDLTQYTIAVDRGNEKISYLYKEYDVAMLRLLKYTSDSAAAHELDLSMCGELASDIEFIPLIIGLGFRKLSMHPASLLSARRLIRSLNYSDCQVLAKKALDMTSCRDIEELVEKFNAEIRDNQQG